MFWKRFLAFATIAAAFASHPAAIHAQTTVSAPSRKPSVVEFRYAFTGTFTRDVDGKVHVTSYPHVTEVVPSSPAARAGLRTGDQIIAVNGRDGMNTPLFQDVRVGTRVVLRIRRDDEEREITFIPRDPPRSRPGE
jgi:C-terminal processing protease CtpA/Prc